MVPGTNGAGISTNELGKSVDSDRLTQPELGFPDATSLLLQGSVHPVHGFRKNHSTQVHPKPKWDVM